MTVDKGMSFRDNLKMRSQGAFGAALRFACGIARAI